MSNDAASLGRLSTTNAQGAQSFPPALAAQLAGRNIAIALDRDPAGYRRGLTLHDLLGEPAGAARQDHFMGGHRLFDRIPARAVPVLYLRPSFPRETP